MTSYLGVLRHQDFRYLFLGQAASMIGDRVVVVALALFITLRTGSPADLGLVLGAQTLTLVVLLLFGGVWADRLPRHRIMIATDLTRAALHATLAVLIFTGAVRIWQIVVIEAAFGAAQAFFQPAYTGLVPQTVPESEIQDARALTQSMENLAFLPARPLRTGLLLSLAWPLQGAVLSLGAPVALVVACAFANGFGFALLMVWWETALAHHIPPHALSRVSAYDWMGSLALMPVGYLLAGPLADAFGPRVVLGVGS